MTTEYRQARDAILHQRESLATAIVEQEFRQHPELEARYGPIGRQRSREDAGYHLAYLGESIGVESPPLFDTYVAWAKVVLACRGVLPADLARHLDLMREVLHGRLPAPVPTLTDQYLGQALARLPAMPEDLPSLLLEGAPRAATAREYLGHLLAGDRHAASALILGAVEGGATVQDMYMYVFQPVQHEIGRLWQTHRISVAQEHYCTAATQMIMSQLYPHIFASHKRGGHTLVATCVAGDLHEIGVRMVADVFEMQGWRTVYLGANTPHTSVIQTLVEQRADVLAVSATMVYHLGALEALIRAVRAEPACQQVRILAGGYPFNIASDLWRRLGADGYAADAIQACQLAEAWVAQPAGADAGAH